MEVKSRAQLGALLVELGINNKPVAEIGVAEGLNSRDMLQFWDIPFLYLVDRWAHAPIMGDSASPQQWHDSNYENVLKLMAPFEGRYKILKGESVDMAEHIPDGSLAMVYIDGDHSYEGALNDLRTWGRKVMSGGIIAGHDYLNKDYGVFDAVRDYTTVNNGNGISEIVDIITIPENGADDAGFYFIKP